MTGTGFTIPKLFERIQGNDFFEITVTAKT